VPDLRYRAVAGSAVKDAFDRSKSMPAGANDHVLFGVIALQVGLVDHAQLVAAFQSWARDKSRSVAELLVEGGDLDAESRGVIDAMVALHVKKHGADVEKSLAAIPIKRSIRERLAALGDLELTGTVTRLVSGSTDPDAQVTVSYGDRATSPAVVGTVTSDGQRFRVLRPHARGGLGAVFVALDGELHREVALKQILDSHADDPISRRRFIQEAEITGGLEHPGIVPVYGLGTHPDGRPYYAMRFIGGDSYKDVINRFHNDEAMKKEPGRRSLELRKLLRRFIDVCNAIDYAHSRGVLHRDLKPANIVLGKHGETLVVDWGLAKPLGRTDPQSDAGERTLVPSSGSGSEETLPGSALGTPGYMSPEQARGDLNRLGPRSDIYSLGATLYCLLTGRPPFDGDDMAGVLRKVQWGEFSAPRQLDSAIDPALEAVCLKAMTFAPEERYATGRALADDIERWTAGQAVSAWQEPLLRKFGRWAGRSRSAMAALAAAVLVAIAGSAYIRTIEARAKADLTSAQARQKQRFDLAIEAVKLFQGELNEQPLLLEKQFDRLRTRLLADAAELYDRLEALVYHEFDQKSLAVLGNAFDELGALTQKIGDQTAALGVHRKALTVRQALLSERETDSGRKLDVARSLIAVGRLERSSGDLAAARASGEEARSLANDVATTASAAEGVWDVLAAAYRLIAIVLTDTGDLAGAVAPYRDALAIQQKVADANAGVVQVQTELADNLVKLGDFLDQCGRPTESVVYFDREEAIWNKIVDANPAVPNYRHHLANCQMHEAAVLRRLGRPARARSLFQRAVSHGELLVNDYPTSTHYRRLLVEGLLRVGQVQQTENDIAGAAAHWRRAVVFAEAVPAATGEVVFLEAACHAALSSIALLEGIPTSAILKEAEVNRAMTLLRRAVVLGYRDLNVYRTESTIDPLRERDEFRMLMMDLAMPADPWARER
jgi:serine/threonine protein kinase/tetratricopeptide (TPR) repeat protein